MAKLKLPAMLVVAVITGATTAALLSTSSCGDDDGQTCDVRCFPDGSGGGANCEGPDFPCATGPNLDQCPAGCVPEPLV